MSKVATGGFPDAPEQFQHQLGAAYREMGEQFDILAVCSDSFMPKQSFLDMGQIPHSSVVGRVTVTKAAGSVRLVDEAGQRRAKCGSKEMYGSPTVDAC